MTDSSHEEIHAQCLLDERRRTLAEAQRAVKLAKERVLEAEGQLMQVRLRIERQRREDAYLAAIAGRPLLVWTTPPKQGRVERVLLGVSNGRFQVERHAGSIDAPTEFFCRRGGGAVTGWGVGDPWGRVDVEATLRVWRDHCAARRQAIESETKEIP